MCSSLDKDHLFLFKKCAFMQVSLIADGRPQVFLEQKVKGKHTIRNKCCADFITGRILVYYRVYGLPAWGFIQIM